MTADEMFFNMGYEKTKEDECCVQYDDESKKVFICNWIVEVWGKNGGPCGNCFDLKLMKAIAKKLEEKGW